MKAQANGIRVQFDSNMKPEIVVSVSSRECLSHIQELTDALAKGKLLDVEIKVHRNRRSLDSIIKKNLLLKQIKAKKKSCKFLV